MTRYRRGYNNVMRSNRYRPILVILGVLLAAFLVFKLLGVGGVGMENFEAQRNAAIRDEIQHAVTSVNSLSRLGATSTSAMLGKIRQYVHGIEVVNNLNVSIYGEAGRLYEQSVFDNLYSIIESYEAKVASGQKVNDSLSALTAAIDELNALTLTLINATAT